MLHCLTRMSRRNQEDLFVLGLPASRGFLGRSVTRFSAQEAVPKGMGCGQMAEVPSVSVRRYLFRGRSPSGWFCGPGETCLGPANRKNICRKLSRELLLSSFEQSDDIIVFSNGRRV